MSSLCWKCFITTSGRQWPGHWPVWPGGRAAPPCPAAAGGSRTGQRTEGGNCQDWEQRPMVRLGRRLKVGFENIDDVHLQFVQRTNVAILVRS